MSFYFPSLRWSPSLLFSMLWVFVFQVSILCLVRVFKVTSSRAFNGSMCIHCRCLLLSISSYLVVLLSPPMVLSLVILSDQCGLYIHCCIARCVITLFILWSWPSFCILLTILRLFDTMIISRTISWLYLLLCSLCVGLAYFAHSINSLPLLFPAISCPFIIKARVVDNIFDICGLLRALATLNMLCWIMSVMISLMVSMLSSSCSV